MNRKARSKRLPKIQYDERGLSPPMTFKDFVEVTGGCYETLLIKWELVGAIKAHCKAHKISQRKLASMVPGLSQDRVSHFFNYGTSGGITIDKLIEISAALNIKFKLVRKAA